MPHGNTLRVFVTVTWRGHLDEFFGEGQWLLEHANFRAASAKPLRSRVNGTFPENNSTARAHRSPAPMALADRDCGERAASPRSRLRLSLGPGAVGEVTGQWRVRIDPWDSAAENRCDHLAIASGTLAEGVGGVVNRRLPLLRV